VLSLYQVVYAGTTPLGALIVGALASSVGARSGLVLGAVAALLAGIVGLWATRTEAPLPAQLGSELTSTAKRA
jgi:hypothetical protein